MAYKNLSAFIQALEEHNELLRIQTQVDPKLEISEITDRVLKAKGKALLFENTGTEFPVLINAFGSEKRMSLALGTEKLDALAREVDMLFNELMQPRNGLMEKLRMLPSLGKIASWMPKKVSGKGACQDVVMKEPDLSKLPVLTTWPHDGGSFVTLPIVHTLDLQTKVQNAGMYRMQVLDKNHTGMHWQLHKTGARHFEEYKKAGKKMPVTVVLGGDPSYTYCATAPLPDNIDEYMLAGFLRKKKVEMVRCLTNELYVPADADIIIEGYVDPEEELIYEGPFGDHTGYYSLADYYPRFHVTCITHRKNAVYPATIVGIPPQEDEWLGKATERIFLAPIRLSMMPEFIDMDMPVEGVFHNITIVKIKKTYAGQGMKVMNALWGAGQMMFNKVMIVVDRDIDIHNYREVLRVVHESYDPMHDTLINRGPADVLDHASRAFAFGGKLGLDATDKLPEEVPPRIGGDPFMAIKKDEILNAFSEITSVNDSMVSRGLLLIGLKKNRKDHARKLIDEMCAKGWIKGIKLCVFAEAVADIDDFSEITWRVANNIDPSTDCFLAGGNDGFLVIDGAEKHASYDSFRREWPNVVTMDETTIKKVDQRWKEYGLGEFLPSPSLKYLDKLYPGEAVAELEG